MAERVDKFAREHPSQRGAIAREGDRHRMVETQLRARGIVDPRVLDAFLAVPRELFVPAAAVHDAYRDSALGIGSGQTISQPYMVGLTCQLAAPKVTDRVLEVGAGSGYQAAILRELSAEVYTVERLPELVKRAQDNLARAGYTDVRVLEKDGTLGLPEHAPFDVIVVAAGAPRVPEALLEQLAEGGRLILPVGDRDLQRLTRFVRRGGAFEEEASTACVFVPLVGQQGWSSARAGSAQESP